MDEDDILFTSKETANKLYGIVLIFTITEKFLEYCLMK